MTDTMESPHADAKSQRGGRRAGAGRKRGSGRGLTELVQVHVTKNQKKLYNAIGGKEWFRSMMARAASLLPPKVISYSKDPVRLSSKFMEASVREGFPASPRAQAEPGELDFNAFLVPQPEDTFLMRTEDDDMEPSGIRRGDILVVNRLLEAAEGDIVVARINDRFLVRHLHKKGTLPELRALGKAVHPVQPGENDEWQVMGVVTHCVRCLREQEAPA